MLYSQSTKKCPSCSKKMIQKKAKTPEGISYNYYSCSCGEEILDMSQLHNVAEAYRRLKKYNVKISKWGGSLGIRIPKELVDYYNLDDDQEILILPEKNGFKVMN